MKAELIWQRSPLVPLLMCPPLSHGKCLVLGGREIEPAVETFGSPVSVDSDADIRGRKQIKLMGK